MPTRSSTGRAAGYVAAQLKQIAKRQIRAMGLPPPPARIDPAEQMRRFMDGSEYWRVEAGLVSHEDYNRYLDEMARRMREGQ